MTYDDLLAQVSEEFPEFGGVYVQPGKDRVVILMTGPSREGSLTDVREMIAAVLGDSEMGCMQPVREQADYPFARLKGWYDDVAGEVQGLPGVTTTDIDERANRLRIGMQDPDRNAPAVRELLYGHDVPDSAVILERSGGAVAK